MTVQPPFSPGNSASNVFGNIAASIPNPNDPNYILQQLLDPANAPNFQQLAQQQVGQIFGPQLQALKNTEAAASNKAAQNDKQLAAMYKALGIDIGKNAGAINKNYTGTSKAITNAYNTGKGSIAKNYQTANNELMQMMQRLGLTAAAPEVIGQGNNDSNFLQGLLSVANQGGQNFAAQEHQGSLDFNTAQQNIAGLTGNQSRQQLQQALASREADLQNQSLGLQGQQASAVANLVNQLQGQYTTQQQGLADQLFKSMQSNNQALSPMDQATLQGKEWAQMGPVEKGYATAARLFTPDKANQAMALIQTVGQQGKFTTPFQFIQQVVNANRNNAQHDPNSALPESQLASLASLVYDQINPQIGYQQYLANTGG